MYSSDVMYNIRIALRNVTGSYLWSVKSLTLLANWELCCLLSVECRLVLWFGSVEMNL